jgi:hypothetical protein
MRGISWLAECTISFLRRTLLHGVSSFLQHLQYPLSIRCPLFCMCDPLLSSIWLFHTLFWIQIYVLYSLSICCVSWWWSFSHSVRWLDRLNQVAHSLDIVSCDSLLPRFILLNSELLEEDSFILATMRTWNLTWWITCFKVTRLFRSLNQFTSLFWLDWDESDKRFFFFPFLCCISNAFIIRWKNISKAEARWFLESRWSTLTFDSVLHGTSLGHSCTNVLTRIVEAQGCPGRGRGEVALGATMSNSTRESPWNISSNKVLLLNDNDPRSCRLHTSVGKTRQTNTDGPIRYSWPTLEREEHLKMRVKRMRFMLHLFLKYCYNPFKIIESWEENKRRFQEHGKNDLKLLQKSQKKNITCVPSGETKED